MDNYLSKPVKIEDRQSSLYGPQGIELPCKSEATQS